MSKISSSCKLSSMKNREMQVLQCFDSPFLQNELTVWSYIQFCVIMNSIKMMSQARARNNEHCLNVEEGWGKLKK